MRWNLSVLICFSFITRDIEYFFMYLLAIYTSSFENSCAHFVIGVLILQVFEFPVDSGY
jgi:hypothetical protein